MKILKKYVVKIDSNKKEDFASIPNNEIVDKTSEFKRGIYAADPHDSAPHIVNALGEGVFVTHKDISGKSIVIFRNEDVSKIKLNRCFVSIFDKKQFERLRNGEYFSQTASKPITQLEIIDSIKYIQQQGWSVQFSENIYTTIRKLNETGIVWKGTGIDLEQLKSSNDTQINKKEETTKDNIDTKISLVEEPKPKVEKEPEFTDKSEPKEKAEPKKRGRKPGAPKEKAEPKKRGRKPGAPKEKAEPKKRGRRPTKSKNKLVAIEPVQTNLSTDVVKSKYKFKEEEVKRVYQKQKKQRKPRVKKLKPLRRSKEDKDTNVTRLSGGLRKKRLYKERKKYYGGYIPGLSFDDDMDIIKSHLYNKFINQKSKNTTATKENNNESLFTRVSTNRVVKVKKGDSISDVLSKLYSFLYKQTEDQKKSDEIKKDFEKEKYLELRLFLGKLVKQIEISNENQQKLLGYNKTNTKNDGKKEIEEKNIPEWMKDAAEVAAGVSLGKMLEKLKKIKIPNVAKTASRIIKPIASGAARLGSSALSLLEPALSGMARAAVATAMSELTPVGIALAVTSGSAAYMAKKNKEARDDVNNPEHEDVIRSDEMRHSKGENRRTAIKSQKYDSEIQKQLDVDSKNISPYEDFEKEESTGFQDQITRRYGNDLINQKSGNVTPAKNDKFSQISADYDMNQQVSATNNIIVNSPSTNIINSGGSNLSIEKLTGVRTTEATLKKIHMQNYRWV